ncbi:PAP2-domain-containing protein, partial [Aureobasidium melanogenum]
MASVDSLTASFYDNEQYSDIIIKFGEHQIRAHKVILAQQSGYFATAFHGLFQVAWNTVIDVGDEDDSRLLTDVIKYLYRHGSIYDQVKGSDRTITLHQLINIYLLADKYDIQGLRRATASVFCEMALLDLRKLRQNHTFKSTFVKHIARICGPSCFQLADDTLQALTIHLCQEYSSSLFKNEMFLQQYMIGELFDSKHAAAFGMRLGKYMLKSQNMSHEEASRLSKNWDPSLIGIEARQRNTKNFFNDKGLSDIRITYGNDQTILAHRIVLATHSREFRRCSRALLRYILDYVIIVVLAILFLAIDKIDGFRQHFALQNYTLQYCVFNIHRVTLADLEEDIPMHDAEGTGRRLGRYRLVDRLWELNCGILGLALSEGTAFVITGTLKNTVGKPRPDLIDRCQPKAGSIDPSPYGLSNSTICTQTDMSILRDGFRSFPSGHSSSSFAGLFYLSLYLAAKLHIWDSRGEVWKIFVVIIPSLGAALIAASRIMDARHHPFDVIVGSLLGIGCAWLSYRQYFPPVTETWRKGRAYPIRTWGQETAPPPAAMSTAYEPLGQPSDAGDACSTVPVWGIGWLGI